MGEPKTRKTDKSLKNRRENQQRQLEERCLVVDEKYNYSEKYYIRLMVIQILFFYPVTSLN